jgi:hypothetical protein
MNNIVLDEIELTDAELAGIYGAVGSDDDADTDTDTDTDLAPVAAPIAKKAPVPAVASVPVVTPNTLVSGDDHEEKRPCVDIFIICKKHQ